MLLGAFYLMTIVNSAARNFHLPIRVWVFLYFSWVYTYEIESLGFVVILNDKLFFKVAVSFYIPTNNR